jgi:hypothetical protein
MANVSPRRFSGDESFLTSSAADATALDAGSGLGVIVEGKKSSPPNKSPPSRL